MAWRAILRRARSEQSGFTLIELLVICGAAVIVALALFTFQDLTLRQTTRVFAKVDATQRARTAMELIETRLRSSCVAESVTPILPGSTDTSLAFVSKFGSAASLIPEKHVIALDTTTDVLTDTTYQATGGQPPNWTFATAPSATRRLLDHANQVGSTPLFRYYKYGIAADAGANQYLDAAGNPFMILLDGTATLPTGVTTASGASVPQNTIPFNSAADRSRLPATPPAGLSAADAKLAAAVTITVNVGAGGKLGDLGDNRALADDTTLQNSVVLRLTPVPSEGNLPTVPPCA